MTALLLAALLADRTLAELEEAAFQKAALAAAESVVRIETIGGLDKLGDTRLNTGATTGTVVSADGYVLSSEFNFVGEPSAIFVTLPDGRRAAAERVATDRLRKLVLLKVDAADLTPMTVSPDPPRPGQWAVAVGRTYDPAAPNVSVGVVSAVDRVWGLAIQTDAKVSPVNYGGVLADLSGRAVGVLVPLSADGAKSADAAAGVEWYDSGIGFAIPAAEALESARRLRGGDDLEPGRVGVRFAGPGILDERATVEGVHPLGPADEAGVAAGDEIVAVNGTEVGRRGDLTTVLTRTYAGDEVSLTVRRGGDRREVTLKAVAELPTYEVPGLGVIADAVEGRVTVRSVDAGGPADGALEAGDVLRAVAGVEVKAAGDVSKAVGGQLVGSDVEVAFERDGETQTATVALAALSTKLPDDLPAPAKPDGEIENGTTVGRFEGKAIEGTLAYSAYAPAASALGRPAGLIVWLGDGGAAVLGRLRTQLEKRNVALLVPVPPNDAWTAADRDGVTQAIDAVAAKVPLDRRRVAVFADGPAAVLGVALAESDAASGVAMRRPRLRQPPAAVEPGRRRFFALVPVDGDRVTGLVKGALEEGRHLLTEIADPDDEPARLVEWVDWMGRE